MFKSEKSKLYEEISSIKYNQFRKLSAIINEKKIKIKNSGKLKAFKDASTSFSPVKKIRSTSYKNIIGQNRDLLSTPISIKTREVSPIKTSNNKVKLSKYVFPFKTEKIGLPALK